MRFYRSGVFGLRLTSADWMSKIGENMGRLDGRTALITGAGSGIGEACAELFTAEGANVFCADLDVRSARAVADRIAVPDGNAAAGSVDVTKRAECEELVANVVEEFGGLDVLVNSAGVTPRKAPLEWDFEAKWDWVIDVNLKGTLLMSHAASRVMFENSYGSIVNLASIIGLVGYSIGLSDGFNPYPHSKGGVVQMTRDMGVAFAKRGVRVNALCPGFTYTNLTKSLTDDADMRVELESLHPMGRLGEPIEIAYAALYLASDESSFVTGSCLAVDGGYTAQ